MHPDMNLRGVVFTEMGGCVCVCALSPSADRQEEARVHQEQAVPQEGQETDQEVFIERRPPSEGHPVDGGGGGYSDEAEETHSTLKTFNQNKQRP